ncbi:hypothetical protein [Pseudorhodoplanes sp.]|uniref:hypothetical protein n=1 Tax=Pseudorhodoplanes sp. TaxID=1934341 RepID=UPI00391D32E5
MKLRRLPAVDAAAANVPAVEQLRPGLALQAFDCIEQQTNVAFSDPACNEHEATRPVRIRP